MPDLSEQLSSILQNPQAQDSIRQLMGVLGQPAQNSQPQQSSPPSFDFSALLNNINQPPPSSNAES